MAIKITAVVTGGQEKVLTEEVGTVRDALTVLGLSDKHTATINGEPADLDEELEDYNYVAFSEKVKGGCK